MKLRCFVALMLACVINVGVCYGADGQLRCSPLYFGPNAMPVPPMLHGRVSDRLCVEAGYDLYAGFYGDITHTLMLSAKVPLFTKRVNLSLWFPVIEFYKNTPASMELRSPLVSKMSGYEIGNVYVSTDIQVLEEKKYVPGVTLRAAMITASGDGDQYSRYFDSPGYFFDVSAGKSIMLGGNAVSELRLAGTLGFLCWQAGEALQNDAYMYGVSASAGGKYGALTVTWQGYTGWMDNGDRPMVISCEARFYAGHFSPMVSYQYGIRDYPFHKCSVGLAYRL